MQSMNVSIGFLFVVSVNIFKCVKIYTKNKLHGLFDRHHFYKVEFSALFNSRLKDLNA